MENIIGSTLWADQLASSSCSLAGEEQGVAFQLLQETGVRVRAA